MKNSYAVGMADIRPWGEWKVIDSNSGYTIKIIEVNPGESLSLQYHHYRKESWTVVAGVATVFVNGQQHELSEGETIFIPIQARHKLENTSLLPLKILEIQLGDQLDEQDIVRLEDKYGRLDSDC